MGTRWLLSLHSWVRPLSLWHSPWGSAAPAVTGRALLPWGLGSFVVAGGGAVLASHGAPAGAAHLDAALRGEILATGFADGLAAAIAAVLALVLVTFRWRELTAAGQDPEFAAAAGFRPERVDVGLSLLTCAVVLAGTLTVGPLPMFAALTIPPSAPGGFAGPWAR